MSNKSIYRFDDYKQCLEDLLESRGRQEKGIRTKMAKAADCHNTFVSQVLSGPAHFSLEQIDKIADFFGLLEKEKKYIIFLVQENRAGTSSLAKFFKEQRLGIRAEQANLKTRLAYETTLDSEMQLKFYSNWQYAAIRLATSLPYCKTENDIAKYLNISKTKVVTCLEDLVNMGLVLKNKDTYSLGPASTHLGDNAFMINKHHTNWRMQALKSLDEIKPSDLHYSSVISCSKKDAEKIKDLLVQTIDSVRAIVKPSQEEEVFAYNIDLFGLRSKPEAD